MSEKKCDCEGKMIAALAAGAALGLAIGLSAGWNGAKYPENTSFLIAVFTAVGTTGSALAAVLVPLRQNRERRKEQEYNRLTEEWVLAESVYRVVCKLRDCINLYIDDAVIPRQRDLDHFIAQLELAGQSYVGPYGRIVASNGIDLAMKIDGLTDAERQPVEKDLPTRTQVDVGPVLARNHTEVRQWLNDAEQLVRSSETWQLQLIEQFKPFGRRPPFVIRGRG